MSDLSSIRPSNASSIDPSIDTWIDTHCHLDAAEFAGEESQVRRRAAMAGVRRCVIPAVEVRNFTAVQALAHVHGDAYALGIHPLYVERAQPQDDLAALDQALRNARDDARLVAVGEIGLDFFVPGLDGERQAWFYREQLRLAVLHGLPVILHVRRSADALLRELRRSDVAGGIVHAFNGSWQQACQFVDRGFKLGFGGTLSHDRSTQIRRLARELPLDAVVLETDAPDMPPRWLYRTAQERADGTPQGRNEPAELPRIGSVLAELRGLEPAAVAEATARNAVQALPRLGRLP